MTERDAKIFLLLELMGKSNPSDFMLRSIMKLSDDEIEGLIEEYQHTESMKREWQEAYDKDGE